MKRFLTTTTSVFATAAALVLTSAVPAYAATGTVAVFSFEESPLEVYKNPVGCKKLPPAAHVLVNLTDSTVHTYGDPFCFMPGVPIEPNRGSHVMPGTGSFSAQD
nr:hypothetical protein [Kibdelosporangium sp. MJ126-NF4]CEL19843.1 hypothetical protein [Kibdelosporangium sp. MJ126-NF4]CTQ97067.1 hypothetical protein [Kibdelosporangium sp. MJ126-NF4]